MSCITHFEALTKAYSLLAPYSDKQRWEFHNNLIHLRFITRYIPKTSSILDVGCGIGILDVALTLLGYRVTGIDKYLFETGNNFSVADMDGLRQVWERQGLRIVAKDILRDEVNERYEAVISIATIEHQKDPKKFLTGIKNVLQPDGLVYIATPNVSHLLNRLRFIFGRSPMSGHLKQWFEKGEHFEGHWREYTLNELMQMMEWLNLQVVAARNVQSIGPRFRLQHAHRELCRLLSYLAPGTRDTNIIIAQR